MGFHRGTSGRNMHNGIQYIRQIVNLRTRNRIPNTSVNSYMRYRDDNVSLKLSKSSQDAEALRAHGRV